MKNNTVIFANKIRYYTIDMIQHLGFGHIGGALSAVDCLAVLYEPESGFLKIDPKNPEWSERDYFILSKGHAGPALYATLAIRGYFDIEKLHTLNQAGTMLPSHVDRLKTPGIDMTAGSLGQGFGAAVGIAVGARLRDKNQRVYCMVGDGELNEGQCWEAVQVAAHQQLNNLILFVDYNKKQLDGLSDNINRSFDYVKKFEAFGWESVMIDGHDHKELYKTIQKAQKSDKPVAIILDTIKGKGVEFLEKIDDHHLRIDSDEKKVALENSKEYYAENMEK